MVHGKNRISYRIDRRLTGLAGPDNDATISFGLPFEPEDSQYGESRATCLARQARDYWDSVVYSAGLLYSEGVGRHVANKQPALVLTPG